MYCNIFLQNIISNFYYFLIFAQNTNHPINIDHLSPKSNSSKLCSISFMNIEGIKHKVCLEGRQITRVLPCFNM